MKRFYTLFFLAVFSLLMGCKKLKGIGYKEHMLGQAKVWFQLNHQKQAYSNATFLGIPLWKNALLKEHSLYIPLRWTSTTAHKQVEISQSLYATPVLVLSTSDGYDFEAHYRVFFNDEENTSLSEKLISSNYAVYDEAYNLKELQLPYRNLWEVPLGSNYDTQRACECTTIGVYVSLKWQDNTSRKVLMDTYEQCTNNFQNVSLYPRRGTTSDFGDFGK